MKRAEHIERLKRIKIKRHVDRFFLGESDQDAPDRDLPTDPTARYRSFDYCFNHFRVHHDQGSIGSKETLELSCLQLGFFLASWGMLRGSTNLSDLSLKAYPGVVQVIASANPDIWMIDADKYEDEATRKVIMEVFCRLREAFIGGATDTLVSKTMLGVFGCIPAFDTDVAKGLGSGRVSHTSLERLGWFYRFHEEAIEAERMHLHLLDFNHGETERAYTRAKVIDMVLSIEGQDRIRVKNTAPAIK